MRKRTYKRRSKKGNNVKTKYFPTKGKSVKKTLVSYSVRGGGKRYQVVEKRVKVFKSARQAVRSYSQKRAI